jgi:ABC-type phosphate/phosphonate transport system substrate-binding protein
LTTFAVGAVRGVDAGSGTRRLLLTELCEIISEALGFRFIPHIAPGYRQLVTSVEQGQVAFAWMPPLPVVEAEPRGGLAPIAIPLRRGSPASFYSAIIVRHGGPRTIAELAGRRAVWVEAESMAGYILPRIHLAMNGLDLSSFATEHFARSHDGVVDAVVAGQADVGATFCTLDPLTKRIVHGAWTSPDGRGGKPVEVLATAGPAPNDAIVAGTRVSQDVRQKFTEWLHALESQRARELFTALMRADGFTRAMPTHYTPLREMLTAARAKGLLR